MNAPLIDDLLDQLRGAPLHDLGQRLDLSPDAAYAATQTALPLLVGGLARTARRPDGARRLFEALELDHRGTDPGNVLGTMLAGGTQGSGILEHAFGRRSALAAETVGSVAGIGAARGRTLLHILAPVVLSYLARRVFTPAQADGPHSPAASPDGLARSLAAEDEAMRARDGFGAGLLSVLDEDAEVDAEGGTTLSDFSDPPAPLGVVTAEMRSPRPRL